MTAHRYARKALAADLLRGAVGLAFTGGPLLVLEVGDWALWILGTLAVLFLVFSLRNLMRWNTLVRTSDDGLSFLPLGDRELPLPGCRRVGLAWRDIRSVRLKFFSTKRDRSEGWMELRLDDGKGRMTLDSNLEGFAAICARAERAAIANALVLDETTAENLRALSRCKGAPRG